MPRDYYEVLGIGREATPDQIRSAYRKLARKYHPDVNKAKDAAEKFKEATAAYEVLSDKEKRSMYDQFGHAGPQAGPAGAGGFRPGPGGSHVYTWPGGGQPGQGFDFDDLFQSSPFAGMSLEEILGSLGGGGRRGGGWGRRRGRAVQEEQEMQAGADQDYPITLDFMQAVQGTTVALELRRSDGQTERINVKIPPGVHEGSRVRVRGKGGIGLGGPGDLYIVIHAREHPYFRREGNDIFLDLPISVTEAALGATVSVPTIDGRAELKVPAGASGGTKLRLRGKGVADPRTGGRGDQYAVIKIVLPKSFSDKGKALLADLAKSDPYNPRENLSW